MMNSYLFETCRGQFNWDKLMRKSEHPVGYSYIQSDTKKRELLKNPTKIEEIQEKKFIDRN